MTDMKRCAIIGCGNVGATVAYSLLHAGLFSELLLLDANHERACGEAEDLLHAMPFLSPTVIRAADYPELCGVGVIVLCAGVGQRPGESRMDLLRRNAAVFADILEKLCQYNREAILLVVTNPVDILTALARRLSAFPAERVLGSGTVLDTARLKYLIGRHLSVDPRQVHAFIIGEHGDMELPVFSSANVSGVDLAHFCAHGCQKCEKDDLDALFSDARDAAYRIIRAKGATYYAIAEAVRRILTAILRDEHALLPVSVPCDGIYGTDGVYLSLPAVIGARGILRIPEIPLAPHEQGALLRCAAHIREALDALLPAKSGKTV